MRSDDDVCSSPCPILRIHSSGPKVFFTIYPPRAALSTIAADYLPPYDAHQPISYKHKIRTDVYIYIGIRTMVPAARISIFVSFVTAKRVCRHVYSAVIMNAMYRNLFLLLLCRNINLAAHIFTYLHSSVVNMGGLGHRF